MEDSAPPPIAIVGIGGRFPGEATSPSKLWDLCSAGEDAWTETPLSKFNHEAFYHPDQSRNGAVSAGPCLQSAPLSSEADHRLPSRSPQTNVKGGFFLKEDMAHFDAAFFGMTKAEASVRA